MIVLMLLVINLYLLLIQMLKKEKKNCILFINLILLYRIIDNHSFTKIFTYDHVFDSTSTQSDIYEYVYPLVNASIQGYNSTVFAYGVTGSGKTYTITGSSVNIKSNLSSSIGMFSILNSEKKGIIPRALETIFSTIESSDDPDSYSIYLSYMELYKDEFRNLLDGVKPIESFTNKSSVPFISRIPSSLSSSPSKQIIHKFSYSTPDKRSKIELHDNPNAGVSLTSDKNLEFQVYY